MGRFYYLRLGPLSIQAAVVKLPWEAWPSNASFQPISQSLGCDFVDGLHWAFTETNAWNWTPSCIYIGLINGWLQEMRTSHLHTLSTGSRKERVTLSQTAGHRGCHGRGRKRTLLQVRASAIWAQEKRHLYKAYSPLMQGGLPPMKSHPGPPFLFHTLHLHTGHILFFFNSSLSRHLAERLQPDVETRMDSIAWWLRGCTMVVGIPAFLAQPPETLGKSIHFSKL